MDTRTRGCIDLIDDMSLDEDFDFAQDTLQGIRKTIIEKKWASARQVQALLNILNSKPNSGTYQEWDEHERKAFDDQTGRNVDKSKKSREGNPAERIQSKDEFSEKKKNRKERKK